MQKPAKPYTVHFVCRGNTYRSRLAAAYFTELVGDQFKVTSSGINTHRAIVKTAEKYTKAVAKLYKLKHGIDAPKTQTTNVLLGEADVIVFMNKDVYDDARKEYEFDIRKSLVWHVADVDPELKRRKQAEDGEKALDAIAEQTFKLIARRCRELRDYLTHTAWVDVCDKDNQMTGLRLPMAWVQDRGLWHRGVHVVVQTSDGKYVVGKRANGIVFAPGMLEISLGGGVDSAESPWQAARRETHEELGLALPEKTFRPLFMHQLHAFHPRYNKVTRCHLYVYGVTLPVHSQHLHLQPSEVAEARLLNKRQVKRLLNTHRMANFGRLKTGYKLYQKAVAYSGTPV